MEALTGRNWWSLIRGIENKGWRNVKMAGYKNPTPSVDDDNRETISEDIGSDYNYKKNVFFAFIDVLGFKKAFDDHRDEISDDKVKDIEFANKFREVFVYYFELMNASNFIQQKETTGCYAGQTSDSLYFYSPREDFLLEYIKIFLHFNLFAMSKDVFFRGGISKGNLFIKDPYQFYGESVIYSYLLESVISRYPIIVIDENTYKAIAGYEETKLLIKMGKDGRHYLNIFAPLQDGFAMNLNDNTPLVVNDIDKTLILENIERNKKKFEYDAKNYEKYSYLLKEYEEYEKNANNK